jgi:hypothetical protein
MPQPLGPPIAPAPRAPTYSEIAHAVRMLDGESTKRVRNMMNAIFELANTQPDSIDWANPDHWINERLSGDAQRLARKIWEGSGKALNPRYLYGHHKIISRLKLPRGRRALALPCGKSCESVSSRCSIRLWRSAFADEGRRAITCSCACQEIVK